MPRFEELAAPADWGRIEFISDLHLQAGEPATVDAWLRYMAACSADALFILGDLFEVWIGDDVLTENGFETEATAALRATASRLPVFVMRGNRDFLFAREFAQESGATLLHDPTVLTFHGQRWLLTHGDLLCLQDTEYLAFRAQVRQPAWQAQVLAQSLAQRRAIARDYRARSESRDHTLSMADVDDAEAAAWLRDADAKVMIHGHTHRPAEHDLGAGRRRIVLSDWHVEPRPARLEVLRLEVGGWKRVPLA